MQETPPQVPKRYRLLEQIGEGSSGDVYKAVDTNLDRLVALKILPVEVSAISEGINRFLREARALAKCDHPNIVKIYDVDHSCKPPFIVMEFIDGQSLRKAVISLITPQAQIQLLEQVADALAYAHKRGIIHRDLNPNNIIVRKDGLAKVIDFGWTKIIGEKSVTLTNEGGFGTLYYISPEQHKASKLVDYRTDIFSFGCVLHFVLMQRDPMPGSDLRGLASELADPMTKLFQECLRHDLIDRPSSMDECLSRINHLSRKLSGGKPSSKPSHRQAASPTLAPGAVTLEAHWMPGPEASGWYELSVKLAAEVEIEEPKLSLVLPEGLGVSKYGKNPGWHEDPAIEKPRIWLDEPSAPGVPVRVGRLRFHDFPGRNGTDKAPIRWTVSGRNITSVSGITEVDIDRALPLRAQAAISSTKAVSFENCTGVSDLEGFVDKSFQIPALVYDDEERQIVAESPFPTGDGLVKLALEPAVSIEECPTIKLRLCVGNWNKFMMHVWTRSSVRGEVGVTIRQGPGGTKLNSDNSLVVENLELGPQGKWFELIANVKAAISEGVKPYPDEKWSMISVGCRGPFKMSRLFLVSQTNAADSAALQDIRESDGELPPQLPPLSPEDPEAFGWNLPKDLLLLRAEVERILEVAKKDNPSYYVYYLCAANLGLSVAEVVHLRCDSFDQLKVQVVKRRKHKSAILLLDIPQEVGSILRTYMSNRKEGWLFPGDSAACVLKRQNGKVEKLCSGGHMHQRSFQSRWRLHIASAGLSLRGRGIHMLRHFSVLLFLNRSKDLYATKLFAGHSSAGFTEVYARVLREIDPGLIGTAPVV